METPSSLRRSDAIAFKQIELSSTTVIDLRVDKHGDKYRFTATEWTMTPGETGGGAPRVNESHDSEEQALARFKLYVEAWE